MNLTIIAYRPNGDDYCMGCHMGSSTSDLDIIQIYDISEASERISHYLFENMIKDLEYEDYEITILFDGQEANTETRRMCKEDIMEAAQKRAIERLSIYESEQADRKLKKQKEKERVLREADLKQLAKLKAEYEQSEEK